MNLNLKEHIKNVPDHPIPGINFKDITTLISNGKVYKYITNKLVDYVKKLDVDVIVSPEARGFIFGCPVAASLGLSFVPVRKPGKLPRKIISKDYDTEYNKNTLCMHIDAIKPKQKVVIIDDLLGNGGTVNALIELIETLGGIVMGIAFVVELKYLNGSKLIDKYNHMSLVNYD